MNDLKDWLIVIPARLASQRLPCKPLQLLAGVPLIVRVYNNLKPLLSEGAKIVVAVDAAETATICTDHHIPFTLTRADHVSGTDRCYEAAETYEESFIMNVQGDEPFVDLQDLRRLAKGLQSSGAAMGTLAAQQSGYEQYHDPNIVKAVVENNRAIYFSRAPVPFDRESERSGKGPRKFWQHIGVYAFTRKGLADFCALPPSILEQTEKLEQLRAVANNWTIHVTSGSHVGIGIDTPEDLDRAEQLLRNLK